MSTHNADELREAWVQTPDNTPEELERWNLLYDTEHPRPNGTHPPANHGSE